MKKKLLLMILSVLMVMAMVGCGKEKKQQESVSIQESDSKEESDSVSFDNVVLVEDDTIEVKLETFYIDTDFSRNSASFCLYVTNKCDKDVLFEFPEVYINGEELEVVKSSGDDSIMAGTSARLTYYVEKETKPKATDLELQELYECNGKISYMTNISGNKYSASVENDFTFKNLK